MKILYCQYKSENNTDDTLSNYGINNCYFKSIYQKLGDTDGTRKRHSHTGFEFHVMISGSQLYEAEGKSFLLENGKIFAVPKGIPHSLISATYPTTKYAFTFSLDESHFDVEKFRSPLLFEIPERLMSNIIFMADLHNDFVAKNVLLENCIFETVLLLLREIGIIQSNKYTCDELPIGNNEDQRVELARQFIADNIENPIYAGEVASYCYISEKQLNRLFSVNVGMTVTEYIRRERIKRLEYLLSNTRLTISRISERMGFPDEHGFNIFFKKYNGMPPGAYRKMTKNGKD